MILIGLHGKAGSGKDTVADTVAMIAGKDLAQTVAFADPLRDGLEAMFGDDLCFWGEGKEDVIPWIGKSTRQLMQTLGTEWGRAHIREDIWLLLAQKEIEYAKRRGAEVCIVTDVRYENEAGFVRRLGGQVWRIERDVQAVHAHSSERGLLHHADDRIIPNNGSLLELERHVLDLYTQLLDEHQPGALRA